MAAELTCAKRTRKIVEENGEQILRKEIMKKKIRSVVNESTAGMLEFRDIVEFHASGRLSKILRSSWTESLSAVHARLQPRGRNLKLRPGF